MLLKDFQGAGSASAADAERLPLRGVPSRAAGRGAVRYAFPSRARVLWRAGLAPGTQGPERRRRPRRGVPARPGPPPAGRDIPGEAAQLSAPAGPPPLSLPRACQLGPNLICVLSVRTPLKPNSAHYQQLSCHTTLVPLGDTLARSRAGLHAPGLWGPFLGLAVSLRLPPRVPQVQVRGPGSVTPPSHGTVSQETIGS